MGNGAWRKGINTAVLETEGREEDEGKCWFVYTCLFSIGGNMSMLKGQQKLSEEITSFNVLESWSE